MNPEQPTQPNTPAPEPPMPAAQPTQPTLPQPAPTQTPPPSAPATYQQPTSLSPNATIPQAPPPQPVPMQLNPIYTNNNKLAIASIVLGVISIPAAILTIFTIAIPIVGIVLGALSIKKQRGLALTGLILSSIGLVLSIGIFVFALTKTSNAKVVTDCYSAKLPKGILEDNLTINKECSILGKNTLETDSVATVGYDFNQDDKPSEVESDKYMDTAIEIMKGAIENEEVKGRVLSEDVIQLDGVKAKVLRFTQNSNKNKYRYGTVVYTVTPKKYSSGDKDGMWNFFAGCDSQNNQNCLENTIKSWKWK